VEIDVDQIPWKPTGHRGVFLHSVYRAADTGTSVLLIRMDPGCGYPAHRHAGEERVLVLNGSYRDETATYRAGSLQVNAPGSFHSPVALEGDEPCVLLATIVGGIDIP